MNTRVSEPIGHTGHADPDLEFALETQSGYLLVLKGADFEKVTLTVRRRVGTPPSSAISLSPDEIKRFVSLLGELAPSALGKDREKVLVGKARDAYLDELINNQHLDQLIQNNQSSSDSASAQASAPTTMRDSEMSLFMERDFPGLVTKRKRGGLKSFLGASSSSPLEKIRSFFKPASASSNAGPGLKDRRRPEGSAYSTRDTTTRAQMALAIGGVLAVLVAVGALSAVAILNFKPFAPAAKDDTTQAAALTPTVNIEDFSKNFVQDMLTFKLQSYRQAQVRCMAQMTQELAQKYWQETGFPLTKAQLKSIPQDQTVSIVTAAAVPVSPGVSQVDVEGSVSQQAGAKIMPLHIRLTVERDAAGKYTVSAQKDMSSDLAAQQAKTAPSQP